MTASVFFLKKSSCCTKQYQQKNREIFLYFHDCLNSKDYKILKTKIIDFDLSNTRRFLFQSDYVKNKITLEITDRLGFDVNIQNIIDETHRCTCLKNNFKNLTLVYIENDIFKKKSIATLIAKNSKYSISKCFLNSSLDTLHLITFSKKYTIVTPGNSKKIFFFTKFVYFKIFFFKKNRYSVLFFLLKRIKKYFVVLKNSIFVQIFFRIKKLIFPVIFYFFYFILNITKKPVRHIVFDFCQIKKTPRLDPPWYNFTDNLFNLKITLSYFFLFFSKIFFTKFLFYKYFLLNIFRLFFENVCNKNKLDIRKNISSFRCLLIYNTKNKNKNTKKMINLLNTNTTIYQIYLILKVMFKNTSEITKFSTINLFVVATLKLFLKFYFKVLLLKFEFKCKLTTKHNKKTYTSEVFLKSEKKLIGYHLPLCLVKNSTLIINFHIIIDSEWKFFEICFKKKKLASKLKLFLFFNPNLKQTDGDFIYSQTETFWYFFLKFQNKKNTKNYFFTLYFFLGLNFIYIESFIKTRNRRYVFILNFIKLHLILSLSNYETFLVFILNLFKKKTKNSNSMVDLIGKGNFVHSIVNFYIILNLGIKI